MPESVLRSKVLPTNGVSIVPTADGKTYRMYYAGKEGEGIGFAEASIDDPLTWREHPASPVLIPRTDNWEGNRINQPRVVAVTDSHWRMYYTGWGFVGPGSPFERPGLKLDDFKGRTSNTFLIVEAETPVPWTKPDELDYHPDGPVPRLGGILRDGRFRVAMADGSVVHYRIDEATIRAGIKGEAPASSDVVD